MAAESKKTKLTKVTIPELEALTRNKDYVPRNAGLKIGSQGKDVECLHTYLASFGYLDSPGLQAFGKRADRSAPAPAKSGTFDDQTTQGLQKFQEFNNLPVTGELDEATVTLMGKPRCGFPDVAEYVVQGSRWNTNALTYAFQEFTPDLTQAQVRAAISQAFSLWAAVTPLSFSEVGVNDNPHILIRFAAGNHGDGNNFDGPSGILAHAYYPPPGGGGLAGDTHFDEAETWTVNLPPTGIDLVSVAAHEFGHALGLAHSTVNGALMYAYYSGEHRHLENDDIAGIQSIYGARVQWHNWESLGGVCQLGVTAASWAANRIDCFVTGTDSAMWHKWWDGAAWRGWENLGGVCTSAPAAVSWGPGRIDTFVIGTNKAMWHKWWDGAAWRGWENLGGICQRGIAAASWAANRLDCFTIGTNSALWHKWWDGAAWRGWENLGGVCMSAPAAVSWGPNRIDVFVIGTDSAMWHRWWDGAAWRGWESLGGICQYGVAVASWAANRLDCFVIGTDSAMWHKWWDGAAWRGWENLGGVCTSGPAAVSWSPNRIDTFVLGTDSAMYHKWYG